MIKTIKLGFSFFIFIFSITSSFGQLPGYYDTCFELKSISPIERVGYKKLKSCHFITYTDIIIDATPEQVWAVLSDTKSYPNWNNVIVGMDGEIKNNTSLDVLFKAKEEGKPHLYHHDKLNVIDGVEFYWSDKFALGMKNRHGFRVEATEDGKTRFIQTDQAIGEATWFLGRRIAKSQIEIYPRFNKSLKAEVEKRYHKS